MNFFRLLKNTEYFLKFRVFLKTRLAHLCGLGAANYSSLQAREAGFSRSLEKNRTFLQGLEALELGAVGDPREKDGIK